MAAITHIERGSVHRAYEQMVTQSTTVERARLVRAFVFNGKQLAFHSAYKDFERSGLVETFISVGERPDIP